MNDMGSGGVKQSLEICFGTLCAVFLAGCMAAPVSIAPSTHPITSSMRVTNLGHVSGDAWGAIVLGIPITEPKPALIARDRAIRKAHADALVGVTLDSRALSLPFVTIYNAHIEGDAVRLQE